MGRFQPSVIVSALVALAFFFGCTQSTLPSSCTGVNEDRLANCIYTSAVLDQNPYACYSLSSLSQRETCLRDSTDSAAKSRFEYLSPEERARMFATGEDLIVAAPLPLQNTEPIVPISNNTPSAPPLQQGGALPSGISEADAQSYMQAVNNNDLAPCVSIVDASTRTSCISEVAQKIKNPAVCPMFTLKEDFDLCNMYAKAG
jgi:hypothetical protein